MMKVYICAILKCPNHCQNYSPNKNIIRKEQGANNSVHNDSKAMVHARNTTSHLGER